MGCVARGPEGNMGCYEGSGLRCFGSIFLSDSSRARQVG